MDKKITFIILTVMALLHLVLFLCIGAYFFAAVPLLCILLWLFRYRKKTANCTPEAILLSLLMIGGLCITQPFSGSFRFQYPLQKLYVEKKCRADIEGLFPEKLPESAKKFRTEFMPPIMQGAGYYFVTITADEETVELIRKEYQEKAEFVFSPTELDDSASEHLKLSAADVYIPDEFRDSPQAKCYLLSATGNWNHPHTKLVIIDEQKICWSKLG